MVSNRFSLALIVTALLFSSITAIPIKRVILTTETETKVSPVSRGLFGMNINLGLRGAQAHDEGYYEGLRYLGSHFVRYHSSEMVEFGRQRTWVNKDGQWSVDSIKNSIGKLPNKPDVAIMSIPKWPDHLDSDKNGKLDPDKKKQYGSFCADLVRIVNIDLKMKVKYWETINELEGKYKNEITELIDISNYCADSIKAVDSSVKIVGGSFSQPWDNTIPKFIENAHFDIWSHHNYASGYSDSNSVTYFTDKISGIVSGIHHIKELLNKFGKNNIPIWLTEHNLYWTWEADQRGLMAGIEGGVWDASLLMELLKDGQCKAAFAWMDAGTRYGKIGYNWKKWKYDVYSPAAHVYHLYDRFAQGFLLPTQYTDSTHFLAQAFYTENRMALFLINQKNDSLQLQFSPKGWEPDSIFQLDSTGLKSKSLPKEEITKLLPLSMTVIHYKRKVGSSSVMKLRKSNFIFHELFSTSWKFMDIQGRSKSVNNKK